MMAFLNSIRGRWPLGVSSLLALGIGFIGGTISAGAETPTPIKVFILAGQSNMEGKAAASTLEAVMADPEKGKPYAHLKNTEGDWVVRDDVWVTFLDRASRGEDPFPRFGGLTVGFGSQKQGRDAENKRVPVASLGPELGIGQVLGDHFEEPVLLIKAAWGGRALKYAFRPPSAMPSDDEIRAEVAAVRERKPKSEIDFASRKAGYGVSYRKILEETRRVLDDLDAYLPDGVASRGHELAGFIWFQGWNDGVGKGNPDYVEQLAHFIRDMRRDLNAPELPFVIGELGTDGVAAGGWIKTFREQQAAVAALPEFKNSVRLAKTARYWPEDLPDLSAEWNAFRVLAKANESKSKEDPTRIEPGLFYQQNWAQRYRKPLSFTSDKRYHYHGSGACYYQMGASMGRAMVEMLSGE